jgi:predicted nucleic acid-binding protein
MIVVADTTPLNYLVLIGEIDLLSALYQNVLIPEEVHRELLDIGAPASVRSWASAMPSWCEISASPSIHDSRLDDIDSGERDAIQLALTNGITTLLMDDSDGRRVALSLHLAVTGTVGVLEAAAQLELINFRAAFARLEQTNFRFSKALREDFLKRNP